MPVAKILPGLFEPTSYTSTSARFSSLPHVAPRPCFASHAFTSCWRLLRHVFGDVRLRADRDEHALAVRRERDVAREVAAADRRELGDDDFRNARSPSRRPLCTRSARRDSSRRRTATSAARQPDRTAMPNGCSRPCANVSTLAAVVPSADGRITLTRPLWVSVRKMSPFGATRMARGPVQPLAKTSTLKPGGQRRASRPAGLSTKLREVRDGRRVERRRQASPHRSCARGPVRPSSSPPRPSAVRPCSAADACRPAGRSGAARLP